MAAEERDVDRRQLPFQFPAWHPGRRRLLDEELVAMHQAVDPERLQDFLRAVRWWSAGRDPKLLRVLTEVSRHVGALTIEAILPRPPATL